MRYSIVKKIAYVQMAGLLSLPGFGDQRILTDAGREVLLRDDGTWEYLSDDRFGTLKDGSRARLQSDGSWEIVEDEVGLISIPAQALKRSEDIIRSDEIYLEISDYVLASL